MPIGIPGWPDFAASTASIASARMELASSASVALAVTGESIGTRKLYSAHDRAPLLLAVGLRASGRLRNAGRSALVCVSRRRAPRRDGTDGAPKRRPAGEGTPRLG